MYYSRYDDEALQQLRRALSRDGQARAPAWCLFDNTAHGHAVANAARLQDMLASNKGVSENDL